MGRRKPACLLPDIEDASAPYVGTSEREDDTYLPTGRYYTLLHGTAALLRCAALRCAALLGCAASGSPLECSAGFPLFVALVMLTPSPLPLPCLDRSHHITYWGPDSTWLGEEDEGCMCVCVCVVTAAAGAGVDVEGCDKMETGYWMGGRGGNT